MPLIPYPATKSGTLYYAAKETPESTPTFFDVPCSINWCQHREISVDLDAAIAGMHKHVKKEHSK